MHPSALRNGELFFKAYGKGFPAEEKPTVIDIGSQDVNGSLRDVCPSTFHYIGLDFQQARGVDLVLGDPYQLPFESDSVDVAVSSSCFEHSEMFWLSFLEVLRVLKPHGLFYLNAPSAGGFHRYPVDCWRFYPDSGRALLKWGRKNNYACEALESFVQTGGDWQDFVCVFLKNVTYANRHPGRILDHKKDFENGMLLGSNEILNLQENSQSQRQLYAISELANGNLRLG